MYGDNKMKEKMKTIEINGVEYVRKDSVKSQEPIDLSNIMLIRTYSAGVHFGIVESKTETEVVLSNSRRLHYWDGACSLSQVALDGVDLNESRIAMVLPKITLNGWIEIIPMSEKAAKQMMGAAPWKK